MHTAEGHTAALKLFGKSMGAWELLPQVHAGRKEIDALGTYARSTQSTELVRCTPTEGGTDRTRGQPKVSVSPRLWCCQPGSTAALLVRRQQQLQRLFPRKIISSSERKDPRLRNV